MQLLKGYFINLEESKHRRKRIESHLKSLNLDQQYERFPAARGTKSESQQLNLSSGEVGLWKSWLTLLETELKNEDEYLLLHILEDDARLSTQFASTVKEIANYSRNLDMLATDMYVNPSIYKALCEQHDNLKNQKKFAIFHDLYTGCTSSIIITKEKIEKVYNCLEGMFNSGEKLLPIDNFLRLAQKENKIDIARIAPFTTTIEREDIHCSTIQITKNKDKSADLTAALCTILRQELSVEPTPEAVEDILKTMQELATAKSHKHDSDRLKRRTIESLLEVAEREKILRYYYKPSLIGQPDNPQ